jgi:hypothetical protein
VRCGSAWHATTWWPVRDHLTETHPAWRVDVVHVSWRDPDLRARRPHRRRRLRLAADARPHRVLEWAFWLADDDRYVIRTTAASFM